MTKLFTSALMVVAIAICGRAQNIELDIELKNNDEQERQTKEQLLGLLSSYDLHRWIFTRHVVIESGFQVVPHSHPVLTLNTRHSKDNELLLATFIHEQLHWYMDTLSAKQRIYDELKAMYPNPPANFPDGSGDEVSTHYHLVICHLEYRALKQIIGELKAHQVIQFWRQDHYHWIYDTILKDQRKLETLVRKYRIAR